MERANDDYEELVPVSTFIREDQACALEMIRIAEQQYRPCSQDELFQEAIDLLINKRLFVVDRRLEKTAVMKRL